MGTPLQLGNIESLSDIPIPTMRKKQTTETDQLKSEASMPKNLDELGKTLLPKSLFEQNIVTAVKENLDPEELERNQTLTRTKTPAQLAQINSLSDIPVPDKIKNIFDKPAAPADKMKKESEEERQRIKLEKEEELKQKKIKQELE